MDLNVTSTTIGDILQKSNQQLVVPSYQRSYSWKEEQCKDLFKDINNSQSGDNAHFIGTIIRCKRNGFEYDIVDGQQRLTSISLLLAAIRDIDAELGTGINSEFPIIQSYIQPHNPSTGANFIKITHASKDQEFKSMYKLFIGTDDVSESEVRGLSQKSRAAKKVEDAFEFFKEEVRELALSDDACPVDHSEIARHGLRNPREKALRNLLDKIIDLKVVDIELKEVPAAYRVFNALNSRGLELKQSDLIKSHILGNLPSTSSEDLNLRKWGEIIGVIEEYNNKNSNKDKNSNEDEDEDEDKMPSMNEDDFFYHYLISRGNKISAKKGTFAEYEKSIESSIAAKETLERLSKDIYLYRIAFDSGEKIPGERHDKRDAATWDKSLVALNIFDFAQHRPLILAILRRYFDNSDKAIGTTIVNELLSLIEKSQFVLTAINGTPGNKFTRMYNSQARKVFSLSRTSGAEGNQNINTVYNHLLKEYQELMESIPENVFVDKFIKKMNYEKYHALTRYVLDHYQSKTFGKPGNKLTIEHIIPKSRIKEVSKDSNVSSETKDYYARIINSPGNLILLRRIDNEDCENMSLGDKLEHYEKLDYANDIPREIFNWKNLTEEKVMEKIEERTRAMAIEGFKTIWNIRDIQPKSEPESE